MRRILAGVLTISVAVSLSVVAFADAAKGEKIYIKKCRVCHSIGSDKIIGPGLAGISKHRSDKWLKKWLADPQAVWKENDAETQDLKKHVKGEKRKKTKMTVKVKEVDVPDIIDFLKTL